MPWSGRTSHLLLSPMELLRKPAVLISYPGSISYVTMKSWCPVLDRDRIVPTKPDAELLAAELV